MEADLQKLIDDPHFRRYHEEVTKPREFNAFDVLRNADYEIRHSNVIAWLLQPGETHGIGGRFLQWFVNHLNERADQADVERVHVTDFETSNVDVERELDNVDITVFFKREKGLIAIENKTEETSPAHFDQVREYARKLRGRYKDRYGVRSVLLTASPDGSLAQQGFVHMSWTSIHQEISTLHAAGAFRSPVDAFVQQYLDVVARRVLPREAVQEAFEALLGAYDALLEQLLDVLVREGDDGIFGVVPGDLATYRSTVVRLVKDFRREPEHLRLAARRVLKRRGLNTVLGGDRAKTEFWVYWEDLVEVERALGLRSCLRWGISVSRRRVTVSFFLYQWPRKSRDEQHVRMQAVLEQLKEFISAKPVVRHQGDRYPRDSGDYFYMYDHELVADEDLAGMFPSEARDVVVQKLEEFLDSPGSDYQRVKDYFECLAFRADPERPVAAASQ